MKTLGTGDPLRLGPYRLIGVLGEGGMGKVYVGQDNTGTVSAVKVLRPELAHDTHLAQRFVREARAAQAVTSDGVASVLGAQTEGGRPWIATEFLAGPTLDQAVDTYGPFDGPAVRALASSIARTLEDIHAAGLIHRDLKPPNIVLTSRGPRVIDFGIARPEHGLTLTTTGQIPVTPGYGAPEQVLGRRVAPPADVFSLGAVLVYAATGRPAYEGTHVAAVQYKVVHEEPSLDGLSDELRSLIGPCLAKDPAGRPTPAQIVAAFGTPRGSERIWRRGRVAEEIKERETSVDRLTTLTAGGAPRPVARRRVLTGIAAGGGVALATGGGAVAWWLRSRDDGGEGSAKSNLFTFPAAVKTPSAHVLSADDGDYLSGKPPKALWGPIDVLADDSPAMLPVRDVIVFGHKDGGIAAYNVVDGKRRWRSPRVRAAGRYLSLSDRLIAAVDAGGTLRTFVASTGEAKWTADADAASLLASDDEAVYLVTKDGRLRGVGRSDARIRWTARVPADLRGKIRPPGVTGRDRLVLATSGGDVLVVDTANGRRVWDLPGQSEDQIRPAVHGGTVYLNGKSLTARRISDGKELWTKEEKDAWHHPETWGPPTAYPDAVYATHGTTPRRLNPDDGGEVWDGHAEGDNHAPVLVQGTGVWSIDGTGFSEVNTVDVSDGRVGWSYEIPDSERRWIVADGNRVFIMNDSSLYALPVFSDR
ncbi:hypothetical protein VT50_0218855 [Streptomyces antioxidans]|uniref:Protein kinase domain-containing protein n=1 Tax=Streptomyces antioxidans TaxID=1507734 RepID=A0A1V4D3F2_9ACTN|nr:protein kinase [Streptomyces antioxidans]OPF78479.1 hypothetical protein VT50_0218855 [Streptomyces antioxidans]